MGVEGGKGLGVCTPMICWQRGKSGFWVCGEVVGGERGKGGLMEPRAEEDFPIVQWDS